MIVEPKELEALLDIKEDQFGLEGFAASRKEASKICKEHLPSFRQKVIDQAFLSWAFPQARNRSSAIN